MKRILITGVNGKIGKKLLPRLIEKIGNNSVIASDNDRRLNNLEIKRKDLQAEYIQIDVTDRSDLEYVITDKKISTVIHLAGLISAESEDKQEKAKKLNIDSVHFLFRLALKYKLKLFIPSTCGVYGPDAAKTNVKQDEVRNPLQYWGVSKLFVENLGHYYKQAYNCDFRSIRYKPIVSPVEYEFNGTTDYASELFLKGEENKDYTISLSENRILSMAYIDDLIDGTIQLIEAPLEKLTQTTYNIETCHFTTKEYVQEFKKYYPNIKVEYKPNVRDVLVQGWPYHFDDSAAKNDWGWKPQYDTLEKIVSKMAIEIEKRRPFLEEIKLEKKQSL